MCLSETVGCWENVIEKGWQVVLWELEELTSNNRTVSVASIHQKYCFSNRRHPSSTIILIQDQPSQRKAEKIVINPATGEHVENPHLLCNLIEPPRPLYRQFYSECRNYIVKSTVVNRLNCLLSCR